MRKHDGGVTLLFVLVILALTSAVVVTMVTLSESAVDRSRFYDEATSAQALLSAGEATAVIALRRDLATSPEVDHDREVWAKVNQADVAIAGGRFGLALGDAQGLFNLTNLGTEGVLAQNRLRDILGALDLDTDLALRIIATFSATLPPTRLAQLRDAAGVSDAELAALATMVTILPRNTTVNVNAAPVALLAVLLNNPVQAKLLDTRRAKLGFLTPADVSALGVILPAGLGFQSTFFRLRVTVQVGTTLQAQDSLIERGGDADGAADAFVVARESTMAAGSPPPPSTP